MGLPNPDRRFMIVGSGMILIYMAEILILIGLCTNNWREIWSGNVHNNRVIVHFGLHRVCWVDGKHCTNPGSNYDQKNYLHKVQAMVITGGFMGMFSCIFSLVNMASDRLGYSHVGIIAPASVFAFIAALFEMIGIILYSTKVEIVHEYITYHRDIRLGWSLALTSLAVAFMFFGGTLQAISTMATPRSKFDEMR